VVIDLLEEIDLVGGSGVAQGTKNARTLLGLKRGANSNSWDQAVGSTNAGSAQSRYDGPAIAAGSGQEEDLLRGDLDLGAIIPNSLEAPHIAADKVHAIRDVERIDDLPGRGDAIDLNEPLRPAGGSDEDPGLQHLVEADGALALA
jgi:hypothetical protein